MPAIWIAIFIGLILLLSAGEQLQQASDVQASRGCRQDTGQIEYLCEEAR